MGRRTFVVLSEAKDLLAPEKQVLRCAQDDNRRDLFTRVRLVAMGLLQKPRVDF